MEAYIYDIVRTVRGKGSGKGSLHTVPPVYLVSFLLKHLQEKHQLNMELVDDLILGCVTPVGEQGGNIAKAVALESGYGTHLPGITVNRFCSSGLDAIAQAAAFVKAGYNNLVLAGGVESMSRIKIGTDGGIMFTDKEFISAHQLIPQGIAADLIATTYNYSREELDIYAAESQRRAHNAEVTGRFTSRINIMDSRGDLLLDHDESIRPAITAESLGELKPAFAYHENYGRLLEMIIQKYPGLQKVDHLHHAGNSCAVVDGAALALVGNKEIGQLLGIKPIARIRSVAVAGSDPTMMLTGPGPASLKAIAMAGMKKSDIDLYEINEAFAAVVIRCMEITGADHSIINVNGGAIAMGHPLGATGCMLAGTLLDELQRRDKECGLVTLCMGGGMGMAAVFERC
jgi:acetyl-CoA C-acetyltransferase